MAEALHIAGAVAEALAHCHESDVLHLDLKPANVIITDLRVGSVKVLDFGLARLGRTWQPADAPLAGTPEFMPPEALSGGTVQKPTADIYALGVLLYVMIAGRGPFNSISLLDLYQQKAVGTWRPLREVAPNIPERIDTLVSRLMSSDIEDRRISARSVAHRLREMYYAVLAGGGDGAELQAPIETVIGGFDGVDFVGRRSELQVLEQILVECVDHGTGQSLLIVGESGVGKSRLLGAFLDRVAKVSRVMLVSGRSREFGALVPYGVIREFLGALISQVQNLRGDDGVAMRRRLTEALSLDSALMTSLVPELERFHTAPDDASDLSCLTLAGPHRIIHGVSEILRAIGEIRPVLIALEDLHWVDAATVTALDTLLADPPAGVFVVATMRPVDDWHLRSRKLTLANLEPSDNLALLCALMGQALEGPARQLLRSIRLLSEGNPLFNIQLIRNLEMEGRLVRDSSNGLKIGDRGLEDYKAPTSVRAVLKRTVERVDEELRDILTVAALVGRDFLGSDLAGVGLFETEVIEDALEAGVAHHLCALMTTITSGDHYTFVHSAVHSFFEERLEAGIGEIHRRIASVLEGRDAPPGRLAVHHERAGQLLKAAQAFYTAAREAIELQNPASTSDLLDRSYRLAIGLQPGRKRDRLLTETVWELARIDCAVGRLDETLTRIDTTEASLEEIDPRTRAILASARARVYYTQGQFGAAMDASRRSLDIVGDDLDRYHLTPANVFGRAQMVSGHFGAAIPLLLKGCELAAEAGAYDELVHSSGMLGLSLAFAGRYAEGEVHLAQASVVAERMGDPVRIIGAMFYDSAFGEASFDWPRMTRSSARLLAMVEEKKVGGLYHYLGTIFAGRAQFRLGHVERSRGLFERALQLSSEVNTTMGFGWLLTFLGDVHFVHGEFASARTYYDQALQVANTGSGDEQSAGIALAGLAHLGGLTGANAATVTRWGTEMVQRLASAEALSVLAQALQRYEEGLRAAGGKPETIADLSRQRATTFAELGKPVVGWWPRPPEGWEGLAADFWLQRIQEGEAESPIQPANRATHILGADVFADAETRIFADPLTQASIAHDDTQTRIDPPEDA